VDCHASKIKQPSDRKFDRAREDSKITREQMGKRVETDYAPRGMKIPSPLLNEKGHKIPLRHYDFSLPWAQQLPFES